MGHPTGKTGRSELETKYLYHAYNSELKLKGLFDHIGVEQC